MRKRFRLCWILLFFATTLLAQNNPKIAPSFIYLKEQQSNTNVANQSTNNKYSSTITSKKILVQVLQRPDLIVLFILSLQNYFWLKVLH